MFSAYFGGGLFFVWTYTEYYQHRFVLHREDKLDPEAEAIPDLLEEVFSKHIHHHVFMNQWNRIAIELKSYPKMILPVQFAMHLILPIQQVLIFIAGWAFGSLVYDGVHLAFHFNIDLSWIMPGFNRMKAQHMRHHFRDNSKEFGVITDLWDIVHGTTKSAKKD